MQLPAHGLRKRHEPMQHRCPKVQASALSGCSAEGHANTAAAETQLVWHQFYGLPSTPA